MSEEPKKFSLLNYEIGGWGSLLALVISVVTLFLTAVDRWFLDSNPVVRSPEIVNFTCQGWFFQKVDNGGEQDTNEVCPEGAKVFIQANPVTLINDTSAPHSFTAVNSFLTVQFVTKDKAIAKRVVLKWFYFDDNDPIRILTVAPQSNFSREIDYYARRYVDQDGKLSGVNLLKFAEFEEIVQMDEVQSIRLDFSFTLNDGTVISDTCSVPLDEDFKLNASKGIHVNYSRECYH